MQIREVQVSDAKKIIEYTKIVGGETDNLLFGKEGIGLTVEAEEDFITSINNSDRQLMIAAIHEDDIIGVANLSGYNNQRIAHQARLAISVRKDFWGQGVSQKLMQALVDHAKANNIEVVTLEVYADNIRAQKLYKKFGFEKIGVFKKFAKVNNEYKDAVLMNLYL